MTLHIVCSAASDIAFSLMWGGVLLLYWGALPDSLRASVHRLVTAAAIMLCLALPLQILLLTSDMCGTTHWLEIHAVLPDVLEMHAGSVLRSQFICVLLLSLSALVPLKPVTRRSIFTLLLLALTTFKAATGHAAIDGPFSLRELSQWLHLASIAAWAGGILLAAVLSVPLLGNESNLLVSYLRRLSRHCTLSIGIVCITGVLNSWLITEGKLEHIRSSTWGTLLIVKMAFVLVALTLGFLNRRDINGSLTAETQLAVAKRIRLEAPIMLVILCASGWLSALSPV
ncbi:CopD family protein [Edaphobacter sp. HDX4]